MNNTLEKRRCRKRWQRSFLLVAALMLGAWSAGAQNAVRPEYEVKAEFLPLFSFFVTWPDVAFSTGDGPLVIGVLGADPFGDALERAVRKDEALHHRRIILKKSLDLETLKPCHILFVSKSERERLAKILAGTEGESILTVGELDGFIRMGGIINFVVREGRVRFEINPEAAQRKGLKISSQLLSLGRKTGS